MFKTKRYPDKTVSQYKARLVAKGYHQSLHPNFTKTLSLVLKPTIIHMVLTMDLVKGWEIKYMDVNDAFLNGIL